MVVQAAVVTGGIVERSVPDAAPARKASRLGIKPRCRIGSSTLQVAPSRPRTTSRSTVFGMTSGPQQPRGPWGSPGIRARQAAVWIGDSRSRSRWRAAPMSTWKSAA